MEDSLGDFPMLLRDGEANIVSLGGWRKMRGTGSRNGIAKDEGDEGQVPRSIG